MAKQKTEKTQKGKRKQKISTKMLAVILPVVILSMAVLTFISASSSRATIDEQIGAQVEAELHSQLNDMSGKLNEWIWPATLD